MAEFRTRGGILAVLHGVSPQYGLRWHREWNRYHLEFIRWTSFLLPLHLAEPLKTPLHSLNRGKNGENASLE